MYKQKLPQIKFSKFFMLRIYSYLYINKVRKNDFFIILPLFLKPAIAGTLAASAWYFFNTFISIKESDIDNVSGLLTVIGTAHAFLATDITKRVTDKYYILRKAVTTRNKEIYDS